jgi:cell division transport system permease protein
MQSIDEVGNPFGARLSILANDPSQYEAIARFLENYDDEFSNQQTIIDQISFKKDIVDKMVSIIGTSRKIGLAISIILILMSVLVTFNTISLAIYSSREEISVMRLVGATNFYIRGPFIIEGMISGMIASFIALIFLYPSTIWVKNVTASVYGGVNLVSFYVNNFGQIFILLLVSGVLLGLISSYLAIRRYLRV